MEIVPYTMAGVLIYLVILLNRLFKKKRNQIKFKRKKEFLKVTTNFWGNTF